MASTGEGTAGRSEGTPAPEDSPGDSPDDEVTQERRLQRRRPYERFHGATAASIGWPERAGEPEAGGKSDGSGGESRSGARLKPAGHSGAGDGAEAGSDREGHSAHRASEGDARGTGDGLDGPGKGTVHFPRERRVLPNGQVGRRPYASLLNGQTPAEPGPEDAKDRGRAAAAAEDRRDRGRAPGAASAAPGGTQRRRPAAATSASASEGGPRASRLAGRPRPGKGAVVGDIAVALVALLVVFLLRPAGEDAPPVADERPGPAPAPTPAAPEVPPLPSSALPPPVEATVESARAVKANEAGVIPVIMYHRIVKKRMASIDRTPKQVRKEMERLAKAGYVPITAKEFATGRIGVPAGKYPVVLTFDDGHESHFAFDDQGMPKADTAVGIIIDVARRYPSFRPVGTFWVNREPFGLKRQAEQARAVRWLTERGFEVANHTWGHPNLGALRKKKVREHIVRVERLLVKLGAGPSSTLALPYGIMPRPRKIARSGGWDGGKYDFDGVFLAGAEPSRSPFAKDFDKLGIQRIQSNGKKGECRRWCSTYWLEWLDKHPHMRFTSDGDPGRISVPTRLRGNIPSKHARKLVVY
ncbi:polysaccharide deacetylase family protein [Sinosporangium siamense]|uniref:polysaccharide deacetylase family protein n=1 Tax=Sinosporangium siamense TaxID=1367973 RepID=UPI001EF264E6|nr:polysaccharide deacetylase family protein [Sinosporangium siamense]